VGALRASDALCNSPNVLTKAQIVRQVWKYDFGRRSNVVEQRHSPGAPQVGLRERMADPHGTVFTVRLRL
jgi:hypothetical protein